MTERGCSRRTVLGVGAAGVFGVGVLALTGCASGGRGSSATASAGSSGRGSSSAGGGAAVPLVKLSDVPVGGSVAVRAKVHGLPAVVSRKTAGSVTAFSAICTHMGCTVNAGGPQLHCPCHGSVYDAFTGSVVHGPAPAALTAIPVKVVDGEVVAT